MNIDKDKMKVSEAIYIQKQYVSNKYDKTRYPNYILKESMKVLTKAYDTLWEYLEENHQEVLDEYLINLKED